MLRKDKLYFWNLLNYNELWYFVVVSMGYLSVRLLRLLFNLFIMPLALFLMSYDASLVVRICCVFYGSTLMRYLNVYRYGWTLDCSPTQSDLGFTLSRV